MIELHVHLDGSLRPATVLDLAREQEIDLGTTDVERIREKMAIPGECPDLSTYLATFDLPLLVLGTKEALRRVARELVEDLAAEGITYAEIRFAPVQSIRGGLTQREVAECVEQGVREGMRRCPGIRVGLIVCMMRGPAGPSTTAANLETVELAASMRNDVICALDLAGAETLFPTEEYKEAFALAAKLGMPFTIHAGEGAGPESVRSALAFGAQRIGHGVRSIEDAALVRELAERKIPLEICIKSNWQTKCTKTLEAHPIRKLYDAGVRVTLNTDNRTISATSLTEEIALAKKLFGFTQTDIDRMQEWAWQGRFLR